VSAISNPATNVTVPTRPGRPDHAGRPGQLDRDETVPLWAKLCHSGNVGCRTVMAATTSATVTTGASSSAPGNVTPPGFASTDVVIGSPGSIAAGQAAVTIHALGHPASHRLSFRRLPGGR